MARKKNVNKIPHLSFRSNEINVSEHFIQRWNERLGENLSAQDIVIKLRNLANKKWGIYHDCKDYYVLDEDIVIVAVKDEEVIELVTVLGKMSDNPILNNLRFMNQVYRDYGRVSLCTDKELTYQYEVGSW